MGNRRGVVRCCRRCRGLLCLSILTVPVTLWFALSQQMNTISLDAWAESIVRDTNNLHTTQKRLVNVRESPGNTWKAVSNLDLQTIKIAMLLSSLNRLRNISNYIESKGSEDNVTNDRGKCWKYEKEARQERAVVAGIWRPLTDYNVSDVAIVTQLSPNKMSALERILGQWPAPVSVTVYVDLSKTPEVLWEISRSTLLLSRTNIDLHLVARRGKLYPANLLRHVAMTNTRATYVQILDIDFLPSPNLHRVLRTATGQSDMSKEVLVVPAFEFPTQNDVTTFPATQADLVALWEAKAVMPFHWKFKVGHGATNYKRWRNARIPYMAVYVQPYEPYFTIRRDRAPEFDRSFIGFGGNKISFVMHVYASGFDFKILPAVYIIHYPHQKPGAPELGCSFAAMKKHAANLRALYPKRPVRL